jgi:hypothetical protein
MILPRQARDKHRENSQKDRFLADRLLPQLRRRIAPGGTIYMVLEALNKPEEVCALLHGCAA